MVAQALDLCIKTNVSTLMVVKLRFGQLSVLVSAAVVSSTGGF